VQTVTKLQSKKLYFQTNELNYHTSVEIKLLRLQAKLVAENYFIVKSKLKTFHSMALCHKST